MAITPREIAIRFAPPKTDADRLAIKARISRAGEEFALLVHELVPGSREESQAIKACEHAVSWAHAGIDRRYVAAGERKPGFLPDDDAADDRTDST
ncbi:Acb2/Tad1 domain-containing protein [[Kitasatospora] papulosa]|uniref:Acb2/Tad1 domain-containing protein n=1 Tax=[Kitasatospora] papulosa TaxID=1464011 RepID=UPI0036B3D137